MVLLRGATVCTIVSTRPTQSEEVETMAIVRTVACVSILCAAASAAAERASATVLPECKLAACPEARVR